MQPTDYARLVEQLVESKIPIRVISFQGFEVTLPRSWPYVEAVFSLAKRHGIRRSFVTNGMLLDKHTERIEALDPMRIGVSLDGADPETNDALRGVSGAFRAATESVTRFLRRLPRFAERMSAISTLYSEENARSLTLMPSLLADLGISRWALGFELAMKNGVEVPVQSRETLVEWCTRLRDAADRKGVTFYVNDEFSFFGETESDPRGVVRSKRLFDPDCILRVLPTGHVRVGREVLRAWDEPSARHWNPRKDHIATVIGYEKRCRA